MAASSMVLAFTDSHCHLDFSLYDGDRDAVLTRAKHLGISRFIVPAIAVQHWSRLQQLMQTYADSSYQLYPAYGLHPMFMAKHQDNAIEQLTQFLAQEHAEYAKPIAIGECGLDFYLPNPDRQAQLKLFEAQCALAQAHDLPLIIHSRKALDQILKVLRCYQGVSGVIHSFSGSEQQAKQLLDLGFYLGFGGTLTYPRAQRLRRLAKSLPIERFLLETDAPDQPDSEWRGRRNEPARVYQVAEILAKLRGIDLVTLSRITEQNIGDLFRLHYTTA